MNIFELPKNTWWEHMELVAENVNLKSNSYQNCPISNETKKILCDIGLPDEPVSFLQFTAGQEENRMLDEEHIVIGNDFGTYICVNRDDEIVSIDMEGEYPVRFINKNLEKLLRFIIIYKTYEDKIGDPDVGNDEIKQIISEIRNQFHRIDKQALESDENWWSIILEQIELEVM